jgi:hypothetical protein
MFHIRMNSNDSYMAICACQIFIHSAAFGHFNCAKQLLNISSIKMSSQPRDKQREEIFSPALLLFETPLRI